MFKRRLKILLGVLLVGLLTIALRLAWLQISRADHYAAMAQAQLARPGYLLDTLRGRIIDRRGRTLAADRPTFDICLHYKLTRLYDERFWRYQNLKDANAQRKTGKSIVSGRKYLRSFHLSNAEIEKFRQIRNSEPTATLQQLREYVTAKADALLADLALTCEVPTEKIYLAIATINDGIHAIQLACARRKYYKQQDLPLPANNIVDDFKKRVPDPQHRLLLACEFKIAEMNQSHAVIRDISKNTALAVEEAFVGLLAPRAGATRPVSVRTSTARDYPYENAACHLIGQIGPSSPDIDLPPPSSYRLPSEEQLAAYRIGDRTGGWGIERTFEKTLRGRRGWLRHDIDDIEVQRNDPIMGADVALTIDIELQMKIQRLFEEKQYNGAAVVIDVDRAEVLAAVSSPTFDLNTYYDDKHYRSIMLEQSELFWRNRALEMPYQPGSTIKPTILLGALETNSTRADRQYDCNIANKWWSGKPEEIHNHGLVDSREAIKRSCNFYFIGLGKQMGSDRLAQWLKQVGFRHRILTWPDADSEDRAVRAFRETKGYLYVHGQSSLNAAYRRFVSHGLRPLECSVLQMANTMATIARDGVLVSPRLTKSAGYPLQKERVASSANAAIVTDAMRAVVNEPGGTAYEAFWPIPWPKNELVIYGKTGTTDYSVFSCFAKAADGRRIALAIVAEVRASGSAVAAPIARDVLIYCGELGYLPANR